jgi:CubicO group peptidase (beta-lactamase class C family)
MSAVGPPCRSPRRETARSVLRLVALAVAVSVPVGSAWAQTDEFDPERTREVLTREIEKQLARGTASISIALVRGEEVVWTAAFGHANAWSRTPAVPETLYCTAQPACRRVRARRAAHARATRAALPLRGAPRAGNRAPV